MADEDSVLGKRERCDAAAQQDAQMDDSDSDDVGPMPAPAGGGKAKKKRKGMYVILSSTSFPDLTCVQYYHTRNYILSICQMLSSTTRASCTGISSISQS
jgi:hypothetical protein